MPMCSANSPMERPSSPRVVARLAAARRIARRLSTPSARGFRPGRLPPSDRLVAKSWLFMLDILARPVVLFKERTVVLFIYRSGNPEDQAHEPRTPGPPLRCPRFRRGEVPAAEH